MRSIVPVVVIFLCGLTRAAGADDAPPASADDAPPAPAADPVQAVEAAPAPDAPPAPSTPLGGRVLDATHGGPVAGALVMIAGERGLERTLTTDAAGRYGALVRPGTYRVIFVHGESRTSGHVTVGAGAAATLDGRVDSVAGEVIVIRDRVKPMVPPRPVGYVATKAPPYSDRAVLSNAWTRAWFLLDLDEQGRLVRYKFLRRPGYDLEAIAVAELRKLRFEPARDRDGKPARTWLVWSIEWPSAWWLAQESPTLPGTRAGKTGTTGFPPRPVDAAVPCHGSPWVMGSILAKTVTKDCSRPDLSKAAAVPWIAL